MKQKSLVLAALLFGGLVFPAHSFASEDGNSNDEEVEIFFQDGRCGATSGSEDSGWTTDWDGDGYSNCEEMAMGSNLGDPSDPSGYPDSRAPVVSGTIPDPDGEGTLWITGKTFGLPAWVPDNDEIAFPYGGKGDRPAEAYEFPEVEEFR